MDKVKVWLSPMLHDYQQTTAEWLDELREQKLRYAARVKDDVEPFTGTAELFAPEIAGLLTPPWVESLLPVFYLLEDGEIEGIINISTSDLFGITEICVTLRDEADHLLEKGYAELNDDCVGIWAYAPCVSLGVGASLSVRAVASDALGGMHILEERITLTEEYLREWTDNTEWLMKNQ